MAQTASTTGGAATPDYGAAGYRTRPATQRRRRSNAIVWTVVGLIAAIVAAIWIWSYVASRADDRGTAGIGQILDTPAAYAGQYMTLEGDVEQMLAPASFTLDEGLGGRELLVVNSTGEPVTITKDSEVRVSGNIHVFDLVEMESDVGYDLDDEVFRVYEGKPVMMATSITTVERD